MNNSIIEISKKKTKAGRVPIKMILHELHTSDDQYNKNGINWVRQHCESNIDSIKGMQLVTQFIDNEHKIPFGDHGNMIVEENKVIFEDSLVVGSFEKGYVLENIEVNGKIIDVVVGEGYLYNQRFPALVDYLQEEHDKGHSIEGSVEIMAATSLGNDKIIYEGGWKKKGRKPQIFEYSGHAIVIGTTPADDSALMLELNSYREKNILKGGIVLEDLIREKDSKILDLTTQINELNLEIKQNEVTITEKDNKIEELNAAIVEVNKELQLLKSKKEEIELEANSLREFKEKTELENKKAVVNQYFEKEISKNGFSEAEINSLKLFVESIDLDGLKAAEAELCVKKYKEIKNVKPRANSNDDVELFVKTFDLEDDVDDIEAARRLLFQE